MVLGVMEGITTNKGRAIRVLDPYFILVYAILWVVPNDPKE